MTRVTRVIILAAGLLLPRVGNYDWPTDWATWVGSRDASATWKQKFCYTGSSLSFTSLLKACFKCFCWKDFGVQSSSPCQGKVKAISCWKEKSVLLSSQEKMSLYHLSRPPDRPVIDSRLLVTHRLSSLTPPNAPSSLLQRFLSSTKKYSITVTIRGTNMIIMCVSYGEWMAGRWTCDPALRVPSRAVESPNFSIKGSQSLAERPLSLLNHQLQCPKFFGWPNFLGGS